MEKSNKSKSQKSPDGNTSSVAWVFPKTTKYTQWSLNFFLGLLKIPKLCQAVQNTYAQKCDQAVFHSANK